MSEEKQPLLNLDLGSLAKPATVLIKKISGACGILYEPTRIRKKAEAEAEAEKIKALASFEISEIEKRGIERFVFQEGRKQKNIESITEQAIGALRVDTEVDRLEEDWIAFLFESCDTVSDKQMQSLWANILAGEANKSGSFSKKTISLIATLEKSDAELFTVLCQYCAVDGDKEFIPLIYNLKDDVYTKSGLSFSKLKHLDALGLISFDSPDGFLRTWYEKTDQIFYFGTPILVEFPKETDNDLRTGTVFFTQPGAQLASISGAKFNDDFYNYIVNRWVNKERFILSTPLDLIGVGDGSINSPVTD